MIQQLLTRWCVAGAIVLGAGGVFWAARAAAPENPPAAGASGAAPTTSPAGAVAASQPASERVLVRVGNRDSGIITQEEFDAYFYGGQPDDFARAKDKFMRELVERKWMLLYAEDHPELNVEATVHEQIQALMKRQNLKTDQELENWLHGKSLTTVAWQRLLRFQAAKSKLTEMGEKKPADEETLKKIFDADPAAFNGTRMGARHILIGYAMYDPPEQKKAKREKAEKIREDLVSGKRTWEDALQESTDSTKTINGDLPGFTRHELLMEDLAAVLYPMELNKVGPVVETPFGYHIVTLFRRDPGTRSFEESKADIKKWLRREPYIAAIHEAMQKYPVVGVQPPVEPVRPAYMRPALPSTRDPQNRPATRPGTQLHPMTRPGPMQPGIRQSAPMRPGAGPATRPAVGIPSPTPG